MEAKALILRKKMISLHVAIAALVALLFHADPAEAGNNAAWTAPAKAVAAPFELALPAMLNIEWRQLPDLPKFGPLDLDQGFQDSDGGWIDNTTLVTAFGYSGGGLGGFRNSSFAFDLDAPERGWQRLPDAPVSGRQEVSATVVNGSLYFLGGFSYRAPFTYRDFLMLRRDAADRWAWTQMPDFPYAVQSAGVASIGSTIYAFGGCDYDSLRFYCEHDRHGNSPVQGLQASQPSRPI